MHLLAQRGDARIAGKGDEHQRGRVQKNGPSVAAIGPEERHEVLRSVATQFGQGGKHEENEREQRHRHDDDVGKVRAANAENDDRGQGENRRDGDRHHERLESEKLEQVSGEAERRRCRRGSLGAKKHPACGEAERRREIGMAVFIRAAAHRQARRKLRTAQRVERGDERRKADGEQHRGARDAGGNTDADEHAGADHGAEAHHGGAENADLALQLARRVHERRA